jgi:hypothetical protein
LKWFYIILGIDKDTAEREDLWNAFYDYFVNTTLKTLEKAFLQKHRIDEEARSQVHTFLVESCLLIRDCQSEFSTLLNEWLNATKARIADKNYRWRDS